MASDTITINIADDIISYDDNMNSNYVGVLAQDVGTITIPNGTAGPSYISTVDTITLTGIDDMYINVTKLEHNELIDRVAKLEAMMAEEAELRAKHPALKMAYDEYRLLLVLTKQHTPDILTDE